MMCLAFERTHNVLIFFIATILTLSKDKKFYEVDMRHLRVEMEKVALLVNENKGQ